MKYDINRPDYYWLNSDSRTFLARGYLAEGMSGEERVAQIAARAEELLGKEGFAEKFKHYMARGYFSLSSPVWSNFGLAKGLPISCFGSYIDDSIEGLMDTLAEVGVMSKVGGGTSAYFGAVRGRGSEIKGNGLSNGSFPFTRLFDTIIDVISQGSSRKGQFAGYIDVEHSDIEEWLDIHTEGNPIQLMYYGVCVGNDWLEEMKAGDKDKRRIWAKIIQRRVETGIPYIFFKDNANSSKPAVYKDKDMTIYASNLCGEIMLPASVDESFVCCLSSMNLLWYNEWKDTDAVETLTYFLDAVMSEFIDKGRTIKHLERAVRFAERHRALGVGVLGWHSLLQSQGIPFESFEAMMLNAEIFKHLEAKTKAASEKMAVEYGEPAVLKGYGLRNTTTVTVAPTKSSSFILGGVSPSIEPLKSNYFVKDLAKVKTTYKNEYLQEVLREYDMDTEEVWNSILIHGGSVQHLEELPAEVREVFKTFAEISQMVVLQQAAQRQRYINQGQSINIMVHPKTPTKDINQLYLFAAENGVKSLYYQFSVNAAQEFNRSILTCTSCEA